MASLTLDERSLAHNITVTVTVKVKKSYLLRFGFYVIRLGCWIAGMQYEEA